MSGERSEKATEQRKKKAREKGDVVRSRELNASLAMLGGLLVLAAASQKFLNAWRESYVRMLNGARNFDQPVSGTAVFLRDAAAPVFTPVLIVLITAFIAALISGLMQGGGVSLRVNALAIQPSRLSPGSNLKQIFSTRSLVRLGKSLVPATAVVMLSVVAIRHLLTSQPAMSMLRLPEAFSSAYAIALHAGWIMLAWSALDYANEYSGWTRRLKMTKQEIREESRDSNGNPQIKGRMRQIQRAMAKRKRRADVSQASVLVMNPTHFAVALEFSFETMQAPKVLAKGRDLIALQMRDEARWAGVPIVENPPLARALYRSVEAGQSIPFELYAAVAGVLAYLYRHQVERARRDATPQEATA